MCLVASYRAIIRVISAGVCRVRLTLSWILVYNWMKETLRSVRWLGVFVGERFPLLRWMGFELDEPTVIQVYAT